MSRAIVAVVLVAAALVALGAGVGLLGQSSSAPSSSPSTASAPAASGPASLPAGKVLMSIGQRDITSGEVETFIGRLPRKIQDPRTGQWMEVSDDDRQHMRDRYLSKRAFELLADCYMDSQKIEATDQELKAKADEIASAQRSTIAELKATAGLTDEIIRHEVRVSKMIDAATSPQKIDEYVKAHADYFNGSKVQASHILLQCDPMAPTADARKVYQKLQAIEADIKAGKVSFEEAAKANSSCPSAAKGGDLGEFTFEKMVGGFSRAAFAANEGEITPIVRTEFGFHLIKVVKRIPGSAATQPSTTRVAGNAIVGEITDAVFAQAMDGCPIVVNK